MRKFRCSALIPLAGALAMLTTSAFAQMPPINLLQGEQKRPLTPEERERQKQLDNDYKAAISKVPEQKANDPWADVRPTQSTPSAKTPAGPKKKQ
jgi:hypothetical protein